MSDIPPIARVDVVRDVLHGVTLDDPYRWMEAGGEEFDHWLDGQARHAREHLDGLPGREELLARIRELGAAHAQYASFTPAAERLFYLAREPAARVPVLMVREPDGATRTVFDPGILPGEAHHAIDWFVPSPDGRHVACAVSASGSEEGTIQVVDAGSGAVLEAIPPTARFAFVSWPDTGSFVHHRFDAASDAPPERRRLDSRSFLHRLGDDPARDQVVLARGLNPRIELAPRDRPFLVVPPHGAWMLALVSHSALGPQTSEQLSDCSLYVAPRAGLADPATCPWRKVAGVDDGVTAFAIGHDTLYLVSQRDAPRCRVLAVPLAAPDLSQARVVVPESERVVQAVLVAGDRLLVRDLDGGVHRIREVPLSGGEPADVPLPVEGAVWEWAAHPERPEALLLISGWTDAPRLYRYDGDTLEATGPAPRTPAGFGEVCARVLRVPARDGTQIPLTVVHRKDLRLDGNNPALLTGYGSHGVADLPWFRPEMLAWYERGGVFAMAHLRGGGAYGRQWHEAGRGPRKETTITDFVDCAEQLLALGYTRPGLLAGEGVSAGGIPAGGALVRRPELWAAMVLQVPTVNTTRTEFTENGPINVPEFGSVATEEGLRGLLAADACLRVEDGVPYPAVLLTAGRRDARVPPWQPAKLAARLQAASSSGLPVLLRVEEHGFHGAGATREQDHALLADVLAFLLHAATPATGGGATG
ncbi:prolyl oligopeptidase family serine peptidase [Nonomuraea sp. NPDC004580]|uniref:prolyl oligopeptidase family serine peptidase n=1 Tax=Nonomuraea sp. NPDC004580 TaxID=3154552 RepID=UPI0033B68E45